MVRTVLLVCLLAGCQQIFGLDEPVVGDAAPSDTRPIDGAGGDTPQTLACGNDSNLVACFEFEGNVTDSAPSPNSTAVTSVGFSPGKVGKAITVDNNSRVVISDSTLLDVSAVTMEAWVYPKQLPGSTGRAGIVDVDGQYAMFLYGGGELTCIVAGTLQSMQVVPMNTWTHVACSGTSTAIKAYINGSQVALLTTGTSLTTSSTAGGEIGGNAPDGLDRLTGLIDSLRIYRVERTAAQIAADAAP